MRPTHILPLAALLALAACSSEGDSDTDTDSFDTGDTDDTDTDTDTGEEVPPTVTITSGGSGVARGDVTFTFAFSADVGDSFTTQDIDVSGGSAGAFEATGTQATLVVSPPADSVGTIEVEVGVGTFEDADGVANTEAASASRNYDTTASGEDTFLLDFEDPAPTLIGFGDIDAAIIEDPTDASNMVAQLVKPDVSPTWAGTTFSYCAADGIAVLPFDEDHTQISMRVWSPDASIPFRMKVEKTGDPTISVETEATVTAGSEWQELVFDFANEATGTAEINFASTYDKLSVFPNFGTDGATAGAKTYYVDDIVFLGKVFENECPDGGEPSDSLVSNPGFEMWPDAGLATSWLVFPGDRTNFARISTGDAMFNTSETFTAYEGSSAIKLFGIFDGVETETPIYQEFSTSVGRTYSMSAWTYMHEADAIAAADTYVSLQLKFFNDDFSMFEFVESEEIVTAGSPTNTWRELTVTGTIPDGFTRVQAAIEFWHCVGATSDCFTGGGVYVDDVSFVELD